MKNQIINLVSYLIKSISPLLTLPLVAHTFSSNTYGQYLFFLGVGSWVIIIIDYGFNILGTKQISENIISIEKLISQTQSAKFLILIIIFLLNISIYLSTNLISSNFLLINLSIFYGFIYSLIPVYFFQGKQKFIELAKFELIFSIVLLILIYFLVNDDNLLELINIIILMRLIYLYCISKYLNYYFNQNIFKKINLKNGILGLKEGFPFFIFNFTTSLYNSFIIVLIGIFLSPIMVGIYSTADKIIKFGIGIIWQLIIVNFPKLVITKGFGSKKYIEYFVFFTIILITISVIQVILINLFIDIIAKFFNQKSDLFVSVLRILSYGIPAIIISTLIIMNYFFISKKEIYANFIVMIAATINVIGCLLYIEEFSIIGVANVWLFTEWFVALLTITILLIDLLKRKSK